MKFHDNKFHDTYECKPYVGFNDDLTGFNCNKFINSSELKTVGDFRLNFSTSALKSINRNNMDEGF